MWPSSVSSLPVKVHDGRTVADPAFAFSDRICGWPENLDVILAHVGSSFAAYLIYRERHFSCVLLQGGRESGRHGLDALGSLLQKSGRGLQASVMKTSMPAMAYNGQARQTLGSNMASERTRDADEAILVDV